MALDAELRQELCRYFGEEITIEDFREWLAPRAWNIHKRADTELAHLVQQIEAILSEFDHGDWTEGELRQQLAKLIEPVSIKTSVAPAPYVRASITTSTTINTRHFGNVQLIRSPKMSPEPAIQDALQ